MKSEIDEIQLFPAPSKSSELFLRGPIPLWWLERAGKLPGKALHVGVSLWFLRGVTKNDTVHFNQSQQSRYGVKRDAARRAVQALEGAGLIAVKRDSGKRQEITLILAKAPNQEPIIAACQAGHASAGVSV